MAATWWRRAAYAVIGTALVALVLWVGDQRGWWRALATDPADEPWDWVERTTWIGGLLIGAITVVLAIVFRPSRTSATPQGPDSIAANPDPAHQGSATTTMSGDPNHLDHDTERERLREALTDRRSAIILVTGMPGVGKTSLVNTVVRELGVSPVRHEANPQWRPDTKTLIEDIEVAAGTANLPLRDDETLLGRLEAAVAAGRALGDASVIIVIDSAEHLMHDGRFDTALDEAFDALVTGPPHGVKVVLITPEPPDKEVVQGWGGDRPTMSVCAVEVTGLPLADFDTFLRVVLDRGRPTELASLDDASRTALFRWLYGNPRLAELFHAAAMSEAGPGAVALAAQLTGKSFDEVRRQVTDLMLTGLTKPKRAVLRILAAYVTPVYADAVIELVPPDVLPDHARRALRVLAEERVIRCAPNGSLFLPAGEAEPMLDALDALSEADAPDTESRSRLLFRAAVVLADRRKRVNEIRRVDDLDTHFAAIDALIRAGEFAAAFGLIQEADKVLDRWNAGSLLRTRREQISERLADDEQMVNYNRLGYLYQSRGRLNESDDAYGHAMRLAGDDNDVRMRIYGNLAGLYWARNDIENAYLHFDHARTMALEHQKRGVLVGALDGLARCCRRRGRFDDAVAYGKEALRTARAIDSPRAVHIAVRLARWHAELDRRTEAPEYLDIAGREAARRDDNALRAVYRDGLADWQLYLADWQLHDNDYQSVIDSAQRAIDLALPVHDQVTLLQARTTLCVAHLRVGDVEKAFLAIRYADRYRDSQRSLLVLALLALVTLRRGYSTDVRRRFELLLDEATARTDQDDDDFAAWQLAGVAICGKWLNSTEPLDQAVKAFGKARDRSEPAPWLVRQLRFLLEQLQAEARDPRRLSPVLDVLHSGSASSGQG